MIHLEMPHTVGRRLRRLWFVMLAVLSPALARGDGPSEPPDAVIERWDQHWTLRADGTRVFRELKNVRLNNDRAYGEFADPRITFDKANDSVRVIVARVKRADGRYAEVPDYSRNEVSPHGAAGWPAFASLRQLVLTMSGIEPGCIVELEYEVERRAPVGAISADIRLDHQYPVNAREVRVTTPAGKGLSEFYSAVSNLPGAATSPEKRDADGQVTRSWRFESLPAAPDEPYGPAWQTRRPRLTFSTQLVDAWLAERLHRIDAAADAGEPVASLASRWTKDAADAAARARAVHERLAASFNFVSFDPAWRPPPRPAPQVLQANYGLPEEAAAALLAVLRSAGVNAGPAVVVNDDAWNDAVATEAGVADYAVIVEDGQVIWHPRSGRIDRHTGWAGHTLFHLVDGKPGSKTFAPWNAGGESRIELSGRITLAADGAYAGKLTLRTSGMFLAPESLRAADAQRGRAESLVRRVLPDAKVSAVSVNELTSDTFAVQADVAGAPIEKLDGLRRLLLGQDGLALVDVPMPLGASRRTDPVRLVGAFDEAIDLTIEWPSGWTVEARPLPLNGSGAGWAASQEVKPIDNGLKLARRVRCDQRDLAADMFLAFRKPINELRSEPARTLLLKAP